MTVSEWLFDWETDIIGDGYWFLLEVEDAGRLTRVDTPTPRIGSYCGRIELREDDYANGERSEVCLPTDEDGDIWYEDESSGTAYYAISIQIPVGWSPPTGGSWGIFLQCHAPDIYGMSPPFAFGVLDDFYIELCAGDFDDPHWDNYSLSVTGLNEGHWVDFVVKIVWEKDATGSIQVWRRDEGESGFTSVLTVNNHATFGWATSVNGGAVGNHYWKMGYYREIGQTMTNIFYLDNFVKAATFDRAEELGFGAAPPPLPSGYGPSAWMSG